MPNRLFLYFNTIRYMKPSQVWFRVLKTAGLKCRLKCTAARRYDRTGIVAAIPELDADPVFLRRFPVEDLLRDRVSFLHVTRTFQWDQPWRFDDETPLWNFNLHYFEFLQPLAAAYNGTGEERYLDKSRVMIRAWIRQNPVGSGGNGWASYTIALRLTNWLSYIAALEGKLDAAFLREMSDSMHEQYVYLSEHLEKDLLGNHYFEDLKALVLCALYFEDECMLRCSLEAFRAECREQILSDGMHFELSPMYHKLIFEDVLRVAYALKCAGRRDKEIEGHLQDMLNAAYSLEEGLSRLPLFNDGGANVAKSLDALCAAAENRFGLFPEYKRRFDAGGYYIFRRGDWKLIVDAGKPGPEYIPGHAHCDAMSYELFHQGKPVLFNCGTYAYQCEERGFFRSTAAHNTVMAQGVEQSQCWGAFRLGRRADVRLLSMDENSIAMEMMDQSGNTVRRTIEIGAREMTVTDEAAGKRLKSFVHGDSVDEISTDSACTKRTCAYSPEYGIKQNAELLEMEGVGSVVYQVKLES